MNILVTGAKGFIGKNLISELKNQAYTSILEYDIDTDPLLLDEYCQKADFIFHLAGVNRPKDEKEFMEGNFGFTSELLDLLKKHNNKAPIMISSSIQAELENPYGKSKKAGEDLLIEYSQDNEVPVYIYRFPNVFGKWSKPNYNTVVATFCYNIAHDLPIQINNPDANLSLVYIDDVVSDLISLLNTKISIGDNQCSSVANTNKDSIGVLSVAKESNQCLSEDNQCLSVFQNNNTPLGVSQCSSVAKNNKDSIGVLSVANNNKNFIGEYRCLSVAKNYSITLGKLAELIYSFKQSRSSKQLPLMSDSFTKNLYSTYLSFLPENNFSYDLKMNTDHRGSFTEFLKTPDRGQVSVNISKPGITKGNHWHHTKTEKFLVVSGKGVIRFRKIDSEEIIEYFVSGEKLQVVDIPPGYTHNIENLGETDMVTIMWANEEFDPEKPDTYYLEI